MKMLTTSSWALSAVLAVSSLSGSSAFMPSLGAGNAFVARAGANPFGSSIQAAPVSRAQGALTGLSMKVFDWKRRDALAADPSVGKATDGEYGMLGNLSPAPGSKKGKTRKGRGIAAGQGASCGFGMRGQKSRSGRPTR